MHANCLVLVILFFHATGIEAFDVTTSTPTLEVKENAAADLACTYTPDFGAAARVEWKFRDVSGSQIYVIFDGKPTTQYAGRVTMTPGWLKFSSVTREDNGEYNCEVSGNQQFKEATVALTVLGIEAFDVTTSTPTLEVKENAAADLACTYTPDFGAAARVEWKFRDVSGSQIYVIFDGKPTTQYAGRITMTPGWLKFSSVTRKDNGEYNCEVSGNQQFKEATVALTVLVPPAVPICRVPATATTGRNVVLSCHDPEGSPPPKYSWFKNQVALPLDPSKNPAFSNYTYKINPDSGNLEFPAISLMDSGDYYCQSENKAGPPQACAVLKTVVSDVNVGGIVAGVIVALLAVILLCLALWYAHRKGFLPSKSKSKPKPAVVYQPTSEHDDEGDSQGAFRQKSSFVV
ncbi:hypothetical protein DPEC_G00234630 [Dallia pectoralis]|uniref:Uncharacterized protein n=1 Tax=Dallia pectoralis TaxID=75939 RepID=A0ACC2FXN1_DALPE|nr:hypothetical protein DPEC_G00234630 [Dallia pectoralis]